MIEIRRSEERGSTKIGWLESRHSFSFGEYYDPRNVHFGVLRVLNDDRVAAGAGFPTHFHRDMEIVAYVLAGALEHRDTAGGHGVINHDEVGWMSAGSGIEHSEYNHSQSEAVHFLQIWFVPSSHNLPPAHAQAKFTKELRRNRWLTVASGARRAKEATAMTGKDDAAMKDTATAPSPLPINQDVEMRVASLQTGGKLDHDFADGRQSYLFVASGAIEFIASSERLTTGDAAMLTDEKRIEVRALQDSELVLFDLAA